MMDVNGPAKGARNDSKGAPSDSTGPDGQIWGRKAPRRLWRWAVIGLLGIGGRAYAGEPPTVKEVARVTLHRGVVTWEDQERNEMAFTQNIWISITGNPTEAASWSGGVPGANDVCVFDGQSQQSVTQGLAAGITCEQVLFTPEYTGDVGSVSDPLQIDVTTGSIVWRGRGQAYINPEVGSFANVTCDVVSGARSSGYDLTLGGRGVVTQANVALLGVKRGSVHVLGDCNASSPWHTLGDGALLVVENALAGITDLNHVFCSAGTLTNKRTVPAGLFLIVGDRSQVTQIGALTATTRVVVIGNGRFQYLPVSAPGTSPLLTVLGGVYDQSKERWDNVWGTTVIGPDAMIIGGPLRGSNAWPPSIDWREKYPGAQE